MFNRYSYVYVEDDALSREIMNMIMRMGMDVEHFSIFEDSTNFMERVHKLGTPPDVFLLDIHVRPHSGFEMLTMLRNDPYTAHARLVALTASVMNEEVQKLRDSGFDGAIAKPLSIQTFPHLLADVLAGKPVWHIAGV